jgi:hypothetical protein
VLGFRHIGRPAAAPETAASTAPAPVAVNQTREMKLGAIRIHGNVAFERRPGAEWNALRRNIDAGHARHYEQQYL